MSKKIIHIITGLKSGGAEKNLFNLVTKDNSFEHIVISLTKYGFYEDVLKKKKYRNSYIKF